MSLPRLDNSTARRLFLDKHRLLERPQGPASGADLLALIDTLGFVQLDSINTVARAHDLILFSRRPRYRPAALKRLYEKDRALFEHWTHDAAVIPIAYYPYWRLRRERDAARLRRNWRDWRRDGFEARFQPVLDQIRAEGPVSSSDVGRGEKRGSGGWWDWHPSKTALEYLWRCGALSVLGRDGFRKVYDLTERVIPEHLRAPENPPNDSEIIDWCCAGALQRLGFATHGEIAAFWAHVTPAEARDWCSAAHAAGRITQVEVEDAAGLPRRAYAFPEEVKAAPALPSAPGRLCILSPFDPALRDRRRALRLFGFDYRIEVFVPAAKRVYGYYVFPILQGERLVGRIDMKALRDTDELCVSALWPEQGVVWGSGRQRQLEAELQRLTALAGVSRVTFADGWSRGSAQHQF